MEALFLENPEKIPFPGSCESFGADRMSFVSWGYEPDALWITAGTGAACLDNGRYAGCREERSELILLLRPEKAEWERWRKFMAERGLKRRIFTLPSDRAGLFNALWILAAPDFGSTGIARRARFEEWGARLALLDDVGKASF